MTTKEITMNKDYDRIPINIFFQKILDYPFHWHSSIELIMVMEGSIYIACVDETRLMKKGDVEILNINQPHRIFKTQQDNIVVTIHIDADFAKLNFPNLNTVWFSNNFSPYRHVDKIKLQVLIQEIPNLILPLIDSEEINISKHKEIAYEFVKKFIDVFDMLNNKHGNSEFNLARSRRIFNYIYNDLNFVNKITLEDIAAKEYLNLDYLSYIIKTLSGDTFQYVLNYFRIGHSVKLLLGTDKNITEIALECGFSAPRYFYKYFNHFFPEGPKEFRKKNKQKMGNIHHIKCYEAINLQDAIKKMTNLAEGASEKVYETHLKWIEIDLYDSAEFFLNQWKKPAYLFHAIDLCDEDGQNQFQYILKVIGIENIRINGLFSDDMEIRIKDKCEGMQHNWNKVMMVMNLLKKNYINPCMILQSNKLWENEYFEQLQCFVQNYISTYGNDSVRKWKFEIR